MRNINLSFVFVVRTIEKEHSAARKLCSAFFVNFPFKIAFRCLEKKLEHVSNKVACKIMNEAATEVHKSDVSVDGTWERGGHLSLNGCVSVISIDAGKVLDIEVLSKMCRLCLKKTEDSISHKCKKPVGSSGAMEPVGVYKIFERTA
ncbi:uncharacterized protein TNCV_1850041 [Trichonephila clavipes]|nr:uncharacterized protein TNCV_1850041 [Trichonephila clavipes]